jgi:hypothetical protein
MMNCTPSTRSIAENGVVVWHAEPGNGYIRGLGFSADGKYIVAGGVVSGVILIDAATGNQVWQAEGH